MRPLLFFILILPVSIFADSVMFGNYVRSSDDARITVTRTDDPVDNWNSVVSAYESAKLMRPNGNDISATNRVTMVLPSGTYNAGTNTLVLDTDYIDIVALHPEVSFKAHRDYALSHDGLLSAGWTNTVQFVFPKTRVRGSLVGTNNYAVFKQTVEDVRLSGFSLEAYSTNDYEGVAYGDYPFHIGLWVTAANGGSASQYDTMTFWAQRVLSDGSDAYGYYPTLHQFHFDGEWRDCVANDRAFRLYRDPGYAHTGTNQYFRASMVNVHAGTYSFAGDSESGQVTGAYFEGCTAPGAAFSGCSSYSMPIDSATKFVDCHAPFGNSFGIMTTSAATMIRCSGGPSCAGGSYLYVGHKYGQFSGYAEDCDFGQGSFGGRAVAGDGSIPNLHTNQILSGELVRCTVRDAVAPYQLEGATIRDSYFLQSDLMYTNWTYVEVIGGVTNQIYVLDQDFSVDPPWYNLGPSTNSAASFMFTLKDSDSVIMDSVFEINPDSTGTVVTAESAQSVVFVNNTFNNSDANTNGVTTNVTANSGSSGWTTSIPPAPFSSDLGGNELYNISANNANFTVGTSGALKLSHNLELATGTIYGTGAVPISLLDPVTIAGLLTANAGIAVPASKFITLGSSAYILNSGQTGGISLDSDSMNLSSLDMDLGGGDLINLTALGASFTEGDASALSLSHNLELATGVIQTPVAYLSMLDPLQISGLLTAGGGIKLLAGDFLTLDPASHILNLGQTGGFNIDSDSINLTGVSLDLGDDDITSVNSIEFSDGTTISGAKLVTKTTSTNYVVGTDDPMEAYGGVIYVTAAVDVTAPAVADGMHYTIIIIGNHIVDADVDDDDWMILDGDTGLTEGDKATSGGTSGETITFTYFSSDGWVATSDGWSDGGQ